MAGKLALKCTVYLGGFLMILLVLYVAASGPVLHHMAVKHPNSTLMPWRYSHPRGFLFHPPVAPLPAGSRAVAGNPYVAIEPPSLFSNPEDLYAPLFDAVERTPLQAPLDKYLRWWRVNSLRVCGNAMMILPR